MTGFGILRLTPKYEPLYLWGLSPEKALGPSRGEERPMLDSPSQAFPRPSQNRILPSIAKKEEETFPDEIWDRLPGWMRALHKLKQKARQDPP